MKTHIEVKETTKSYKTYDNAVKAASAILEELKTPLEQDRVNPRFIIAANGDRFSPVFMNTQHACIWFAQKGFLVIG